MKILFPNGSKWGAFLSNPLFQKRLWMKLSMTAMMVSLFCFQFLMAHPGYSQGLKDEFISLSVKDKSLIKVLEQIEKQTAFRFAYSAASIGKYRVSVNQEKRSLEETLNIILEDKPIRYKVVNEKFIVLSPIPAPTPLSSIKLVKGKQFEEISLKKLVLNVSGVIANQSGEPLIGVNVLVKGTDQGTATDFDGTFTLENINENDVLVISYIGFQTQEVPINGQRSLSIVLLEDSQTLDEVVVVGYGTQKKVNLTGSVSSVGSDFLESRPITNSSQALQGVNGIYVNQTGSEPGSDGATLRIRGVGTLNNNNPLVLVDGIQYNLSDVNPNDIESISVLKDAASASIYGNRAANGVVLVTTKKGVSGKLKINYNTYFGVQQATYLPDMVTNSLDYILARNQAAINEGQPVPYSEAQVNEYRNGTDPDLYPNTDWYDIMFSAAPIQDHYLNISGGNKTATFSMSMGYMNQEGILIGTDAKKYSFNSNLLLRPLDNLELGSIINLSYWDKHGPYKGIGGGDDSAMGAIARALPIHPNLLSDGQYGTTWLVTPGHNVFRHPMARAVEGGNDTKTQRGMINLHAQYTFPFDIKYKVTFAVDKFDNNQHIFVPEISLFTPKKEGIPQPNGKDIRSVEQQNSNGLNTSFFQTLNWDRTINENHDVSVLLGFSKESFHNANFNGYLEGFLGNELTELNAGTINKDVGGTSTLSKLMSYFGRINYSFKDKYLLEVNARYDGSSRFAKGNRWGLFPSFSAGWRIDQESFMNQISVVSNLKMRLSWGALGNQNIALYSYLNNININQGTTFNNTVLAGSAVTALSDPNISWEKTTINNIGLDLGLWENKFEFTIDLFDKATTDILARINIPSQVGNLSGPITNLYSISNKGFEISTLYRNSVGGVSYKIGGNIAVVDNEVDFLNGDIQYRTNSYGNITVIQEGYPVNSWYLYEAEGIFQSEAEVAAHAYQDPTTGPGDIKYRDVNNDGKIDINDTQVMGRSIPKFTYGFNVNLDYKTFDLGLFFQGVEGIDIYPTNNVSWPLFNGAGITKDQLANSWTPENPDAKYPRLSLQKRGTKINARNSTFWLKDASYLRLKNIQLGYTFDPQLLAKIKIERIRFYVNAQNALTFSKFKLADPEKNILDENIYGYPTTRIFSMGLNVSF